MTATERFLADVHAFTAVVDATDDWSAQSPCTEWTATDVVTHVVETQRGLLEKHGAAVSSLPDGDGAALWHAHADDVRALLADRSFATIAFDGFTGRTTVEENLADFYGFDMLVHRWDLGTATGQDVRFSEAELDALERAVDGLGDMFYTSGASAPPLDVPADAPRQTAVLARMGRAG